MYQFTKKCLIGNVEIDEEHKQLFQITAAAYELTKKEDVKISEIKSLLFALNKYAEIHFEHEEEFMEQLDDPELPLQRLAHRTLKRSWRVFRRRGWRKRTERQYWGNSWNTFPAGCTSIPWAAIC